MWCSVRVHTGGNRAKPPQARKARRPTTADRTSVLCITSAEFGGSGGPSLTSERMAGNYWNTFAPGATHLSSPTSATKSAISGHQLNRCLHHHHVRFTPRKADIRQRKTNVRLGQKRTSRRLFDHLVGTTSYSGRPLGV